MPDPKKWDYEEGFVRNQEPQYYTRNRLDNARVENGTLIIEARKERFHNSHYQPNGKGKSQQEYSEYTSASLITCNKESWQYGRFEVKAKLPMKPGLWPAFWTLGINHKTSGWPGCGEIDIMECWGRTPREVTSTVHFQKNGKHQSDHSKVESKESLEEFHVYALEWYPDHMDFFFDGKKYHTVPLSKLEDNGENAFRKPHYILLNLALEGHGKKIDDQALPLQLVVKYVRVYKQKTEGNR